jgi:glutamine synthetase
MKKRLPQLQIVQAIEAFSLAGNISPWQHEIFADCQNQKDLAIRHLPSSLPEGLGALKSDDISILNTDILASFLLQAYIKLKEKEIKVGKGKKKIMAEQAVLRCLT